MTPYRILVTGWSDWQVEAWRELRKAWAWCDDHKRLPVLVLSGDAPSPEARAWCGAAGWQVREVDHAPGFDVDVCIAVGEPPAWVRGAGVPVRRVPH